MKPGQFAHNGFREFNAFPMYFKAPVVDPALSGYDIQVTAWSSGEKDCARFILEFFKAAETTSFAKLFPFIFHLFRFFHVLRIPKSLRHCQSYLDLRMIIGEYN
jgi:hypothetical protein